ncbi:MAG TPA: hypothetical protein DHV96_05215 [Lachnospiraceae bacterium]|nr:hypothetical protein [Lachnospiraceae bacterium]
MAGRHKKKTPNVKQSMNQLVETATRLYREPYDDRSGKRSTLLPSVRQVADEMGSSIWRVRKLLITAGYYSTMQSREIQRMIAEGHSIEQIIERTNIKRASVYSYIPYKDFAYNLDQTTVNADRQKLFRLRKKAVQALEKRIGHPDEEQYLWEALLLFANYPFQTAKGLKYSYSIKTRRNGEYSDEIVFDQKVKSVTRTTINLAYKKALDIQEKEGYVSGPKKLGVFGASYIYPIFVRLGVITPEKEKV